MTTSGITEASQHPDDSADPTPIKSSAKKASKPKVRMVPLEERHWEGVFELYSNVFGEQAEIIYRKRRQWTVNDNLAPDKTVGWVLEADDAIVGYLVSIPLRYRIGGEDILAHTPADYMVHPDFRFHGIKLMKEFFKECPNCITADDMAATLKVLDWLGAKESGTFSRYRKVLDGRALSGRESLAKIPSPLWWPVTVGLRLRDSIFGGSRPKGIEVTTLPNANKDIVNFCRDISEDHQAMLSRDAEFFEWRYGDRSPQPDTEFAVAKDDSGEVVGYAVYSFTHGAMRVGHILDVQVSADAKPEVAQALLAHSVKALRKKGAWSVRYQRFGADASVSHEILDQLNFLPRGGYHLMTKLEDERLEAIVRNQANWNYSFGDSEASHTLE